jgi:hypothetical protein
MAIIDTLHEAQFIDEFRKIRENQFSYRGLKALFQHLDDLSEDSGKDIMFDAIGFCCEFSEYSLEEFNVDYDANIKSFDEQNTEVNPHHVIVARFIARDFVDGEQVSEEKVLVHHG